MTSVGALGNVINLGNSIIGVSILAMPYCFSKCGIVLSLLLVVLSGILSRATCHLLLKGAIITRRRNFEYLAFHTYGSAGKLVVEVGITGFLIGACIAFFVVIGDLGPPLVADMLLLKLTPQLRVIFLAFLGVFVALPLGLLRKVDSLTSFSLLSLIFYGFLIVKIIAEATPKLFSEIMWNEVVLWEPSGVLPCLPIFSMALSCQTQLFEIFDTLNEPSLKRMNTVVSGAVNMCSTVYVLVGFFGYVAFFDEPMTGNILVKLSPTLISQIIKFGFVITVVISFPLCLFPCRTSLHSLIFKQGFVHHDAPANYIPDHHFRGLTILLVMITVGIAVVLPNIEVVLGIVGSTIGIIICVILPSMIFIKVTSKNTNERLLAQTTLCVGFFIMVVCTYTTLLDTTTNPRELPVELQQPKDLLNVIKPSPLAPEKVAELISNVTPSPKLDTGQKVVNQEVLQELNKKGQDGDKRQEPPIPQEPEVKDANLVEEHKAEENKNKVKEDGADDQKENHVIKEQNIHDKEHVNPSDDQKKYKVINENNKGKENLNIANKRKENLDVANSLKKELIEDKSGSKAKDSVIVNQEESVIGQDISKGKESLDPAAIQKEEMELKEEQKRPETHEKLLQQLVEKQEEQNKLLQEQNKIIQELKRNQDSAQGKEDKKQNDAGYKIEDDKDKKNNQQLYEKSHQLNIKSVEQSQNIGVSNNQAKNNKDKPQLRDNPPVKYKPQQKVSPNQMSLNQQNQHMQENIIGQPFEDNKNFLPLQPEPHKQLDGIRQKKPLDFQNVINPENKQHMLIQQNQQDNTGIVQQPVLKNQYSVSIKESNSLNKGDFQDNIHIQPKFHVTQVLQEYFKNEKGSKIEVGGKVENKQHKIDSEIDRFNKKLSADAAGEEFSQKNKPQKTKEKIEYIENARGLPKREMKNLNYPDNNVNSIEEERVVDGDQKDGSVHLASEPLLVQKNQLGQLIRKEPISERHKREVNSGQLKMPIYVNNSVPDPVKESRLENPPSQVNKMDIQGVLNSNMQNVASLGLIKHEMRRLLEASSTSPIEIREVMWNTSAVNTNDFEKTTQTSSQNSQKNIT
ncbi:uncharacterized protein LOC143232770 isoform X2 [Tachypleus tridentatus]|uniref:uncharacterized protein LOC143232770 isoform X2 n=1 Tax=Tachypleus tridentatus TaxID=6853 RepID=UPI003FD25A6C